MFVLFTSQSRIHLVFLKRWALFNYVHHPDNDQRQTVSLIYTGEERLLIKMYSAEIFYR